VESVGKILCVQESNKKNQVDREYQPDGSPGAEDRPFLPETPLEQPVSCEDQLENAGGKDRQGKAGRKTGQADKVNPGMYFLAQHRIAPGALDSTMQFKIYYTKPGKNRSTACHY
jgi:hypothetical protein